MGVPAGEFVVLDVETTGFEPEKGDVILEVAGQKLAGRQKVGEFVELIKPNRIIPADSTAVTGITNEMVQKDGKDAADVLTRFFDFLGSAILIGHNISFDLGFLNAYRKQTGQPPLTNPTIDTLEIARRYLILSNYRLGTVATFLKVPPISAHRALVDVETTREVFFKLIERAKQKV